MMHTFKQMMSNRDSMLHNSRRNVNLNPGYLPNQSMRTRKRVLNEFNETIEGNNNSNYYMNGNLISGSFPEGKSGLINTNPTAASEYGDYFEMQDLILPKGFTADYENGNIPDALHVIMKPLLLLAQCFALLPVDGITSPTARSVRFRWCSIRVLYTVLSFIGSSVIVILSILRTTNTGISFLSTVDFVFYGSSTVVTMLFLKLATEWPTMLQEWERSEKYLIKSFGSLYYLPKKIKRMAVIVITIAIIEHITAQINFFNTVLPCVNYEYSWKLVEVYYLKSFKQVFAVTSYAFWKGIIVSFINLIDTCAWNYMDLFIMIMSVALSERFRQINERLESVKGKVIPVWFWRQTRESYNRLSCLTKLIDHRLSPIVLLSFANNLYFICLQLLNSLKPLRNLTQAVYFVYSFGYLVIRTCAVSLFAATIHDESKKPASVLFSVPSECYCIEVERFLKQVTSDDLALTGYRFFSVTRTLMLTIAGTIVTYEIVLVQFNAVQESGSIQQNLTASCPHE